MCAHRAHAAGQRARPGCHPVGELIAKVERVCVPDDADARKRRVDAEGVSIDAGAPGTRGRKRVVIVVSDVPGEDRVGPTFQETVVRHICDRIIRQVGG